MPRWNKHCLTIHPISSHDVGIKLSHHIGFLSLHQLMICDLGLISTSASQNPINRTSDSYSKQAIQNAILKSQATTDDLLNGMKRCKAYQANQHYWQAKRKKIARKTTNPYDYAQMPSWRQIGSDKAKK